MQEQALADVRVLDFTHYVAGPYCTKLLADYGADVMKVERPGVGDGARRMGPFPKDEPNIEKSGLFLHLNTNKRSLTLDLKRPEARDIVLRLVRDVDIVVESFRPGTMESFGLGYESLRNANNDVVLTSISNFGQTGPYKDYKSSDIMTYGMGGEMYSTGLEDREPLKLAENVVLYQAGAVASVATMGALFASRLQAVGQHVDVSIMETQVGTIDRRMSMLLAYQYNGEISRRGALATGTGYPTGVYLCADGYIQVNGGGSYFKRVVEMMGRPPELEDPTWFEPESQYNSDLAQIFHEYFIPWCLERTKREIWTAAQKSRVLSAPLNTIEELVEDQHFNERDAFADISHPEAGRLLYPGRPFIMGESPWSVRRPAPLLGQHTDDILSSVGYNAECVSHLHRDGVV
ncbi:MAG: CoA transferase [Chloroflexi bacterium]|nr:CoA transferase [Chloroflexota bacterium]